MTETMPHVEELLRDTYLTREDIQKIDLQFLEENLAYLSRFKSTYRNLVTKFRDSVHNLADYSDLCLQIRVAILLSYVTHKIEFLRSANPFALSAIIAGQQILFATVRVVDTSQPNRVVAKSFGDILSELEHEMQQSARSIPENTDRTVLVLEVQAYGMILDQLREDLETFVNHDAQLRKISSFVLLYPETLEMANAQGPVSRDYGIWISNQNATYSLSLDASEKLREMLRFRVRWEGKGAEQKSTGSTLLDAIGAAGYVFFSIAGFAYAFGLSPVFPNFSTFTLLLGLLWVISGLAFVLTLIRRRIAISPGFDHHVRFLRGLQTLPDFLFKIFVVLTIVFALSYVLSRTVSVSNLVFLGAGFLFSFVLHYVTDYYSQAGLARVYLLEYLTSRSEDALLSAAHSINRTMNDFGLAIDPYAFRAGVSLGLIRRSINEDELNKLALSIVRGRAGQKDVVGILEKVLKEIENPRIAPVRPFTHRLTPEQVGSLLSGIGAIVPMLVILLKLFFNFP